VSGKVKLAKTRGRNEMTTEIRCCHSSILSRKAIEQEPSKMFGGFNRGGVVTPWRWSGFRRKDCDYLFKEKGRGEGSRRWGEPTVGNATLAGNEWWKKERSLSKGCLRGRGTAGDTLVSNKHVWNVQGDGRRIFRRRRGGICEKKKNGARRNHKGIIQGSA